MTKLEKAARLAFETWWEREGQEFLFALNTTTDDDIKLVAKVAWEAALAEQAQQEPVAVVEITYGREPECYVTGNIDDFPEGVFKLYASPVRTKDLTDVEDLQDAMTKALKKAFQLGQTYFQQADSESYAANKRADITLELYRKLEDDTRAVIAADREKDGGGA